MNQNYLPDASFQFSTLVQLLRTRARLQPDDLALMYLVDGESEEIRLTFAEVDRQARAIAAWLQQEQVTGERALLLYPPGLDFITSFFGCLYAGVMAVPVYPPRLNRPSVRIQAIVADSQATVALTTGQILSSLERRFDLMPDLAALRWFNTEDMTADLSGQWQEPAISSDYLAFLQYTSGSTGTPKGVMLSHGNLLYNLEIIRQGFQIDNQAVGLFWLPSYHDMGLIGGILEPIYLGSLTILMAPGAFLQRPARWLEALSRYRATISGAPNFAYQLSAERITPKQREKLDLSHWQIAFCGAEPIRLETLNTFANTFAPNGFSQKAFYPCYGLAEGTLIVSGGDGPGEPLVNRFQASALLQNKAVLANLDTEEVVTIVSSGHALLDQQIIIVDPELQTTRGPGEVGEIWVAGPSVAHGYWNRHDLTEQTFRATLADTGEGPFLRTGDLGFLYEGELYVTGRLKDLIIIRGRNHYPQDIEFTIEQAHEVLEPGMSAAFSVNEEGEEKLVIVGEVTRRHRQPDITAVADAVRLAVAREHQLQVHAIVLIRPLSIPKTSSGKIKRHACKQGYLEGSLRIVAEWHSGSDDEELAIDQTALISRQSDERQMALPGKTAAEISIWLVAHIARKMRISPERINLHAPFVDYGMDSLQVVTLAGDLENWLGRSLAPTLVWDYPTIDALANYLAGEGTASDEQQPGSIRQDTVDHLTAEREPIAVIGIGCRFPGADGPQAFWELLKSGIDAIGAVPPGRWDVEGLYGPGPEPEPGKMNTRWGGFLGQIDGFDAPFFGISPREAARMDPQQRLLLEVSWEALEHAGQNPSRLAGSATGVYVGISSYDYSRLQFSHPDLIDAYAGTGNAHSIAANRLSYSLDLHGPSMAIDTACSSSLVAAHMAIQSLRSGESDLALAGGVNLIISPELTITFSQARMMAADGRCKTFDARADGYVRGEGCGMIVLKRLSDAQRDGDSILAVLKGSAVNQDGRSNGLTAPNGLLQQAVIRQAMAGAGVEPGDVSYIEAHGTGTRLGDPIEVHSLQAVMDGGPAQNPVVLGSVKTNIGHLEAAAGVAGLIKTVLALVYEEIPPHLHFQELNPHISLEGSRLIIGHEGHAWPRGEQPRLAGVSSFGFGGTNAHIIVQEAPLPVSESDKPQRPRHLFTASAQSAIALRQLAARYTVHLATNPPQALADICYTANTGRSLFAHRLALTAETKADLLEQLAGVETGQELPDPISPQRPKVAFLFTGQGSQFVGMGRMLYETSPTFKAAINECADILEQELERPLLSIIYSDVDLETIDFTAYTQPALFAIEYALAVLWRSWGIEPDVVLGHSVGEYVAACVAGVMSLEDGLRLIAARGRMMGALPEGGAMAAVFAAEERVRAAVDAYQDAVSIAAVNGPANIVISGKESAVTAIVNQLSAEGIETRPLTVSHAFHSPLMEPMLDNFERVADQQTYYEPQIPLVSNLTGKLLEGIPGPSYWREHVRQAVRFTDSMAALAAEGVTIFLEIGPQPHLTGMAKRFLDKDTLPAPPLWLPSLRSKMDDWSVILDSLGKLYVAGIDVDWLGFDRDYRRSKVVLPSYPFQRERHWLETAGTQTAVSGNWRVPSAAAGEGTVRRLPTALPLFEARMELLGQSDLTAVLRENALAAAWLFWGPGAHQVTGIAPMLGQALPPGLVLVQTSLNATTAATAFFQIFGHDPQQDTWSLLAGGELRRGEAESESAKLQAKAADEGSISREALLTADPAASLQLAIKYLQTQTAAVLDLEKSRLSLDQPLDTMGMDSLMAIELKNRIEKDLLVDLPVVELLQGPTLSDLAARVLTFLTMPVKVSTIQALAEVGKPVPLSYGQQAMWILHQLLPADVSFNVAGAARVLGDVDISALRRALQKLVDRHLSLRTTFTVGSGGPEQTVQSQMSVPLVEIEASGWAEEAVDTFLEREAHRPFDLEAGPLMRLVLLKRAGQEHVLLLSLNHLITDFWSMSLLVQDLYLLYEAEKEGREAALPPIDLQMADYVRWQTEMLGTTEGAASRAYWREKLSGNLPRLDLPTDYPRPAAMTFDGNMVARRFSADLTTRIKALSNDQGTTLATTLLAAFQTLLYRYSGQEDLLIGSVIGGRERPELQNLTGYLINPVALRADFSGNPTFSEILAQTRQTMFEAITHQEYPLPRLAEEMAASGDLVLDPSRPPFFETMFIMQRAQVLAEQGLSAFALGLSGARLELNSLLIESMPLSGLPAQFDFTLMMAEIDEGLAATMHYNTRLFASETMDRLLHQLEILLLGITAEPDQPVAALPMLSAEDREKLLVTWNDTKAEYSRHLTLAQLVEIQARQTPEGVAVTFEGQSLTYAVLEERSNRLAHHLRHLGVREETLVGLYMERSLEMVIGLLGVLKAGGAYIPLDPDFPPDRIAQMLEDAQPLVLVTQNGLVSQLDLLSTTAVCLDSDWPSIAQQESSILDLALKPENLAYVIYTSGSTGKPKGVQIPHRAAVNFLEAMRCEPGIEPGDHLLAVTTLSFDIALLEIFLPLISGAQVTIASRETAMDGVRLARLIEEAGISVMQATPTTWQVLLEAGWNGKENLKILCGGEALPLHLVRELLPRCASLWNMYGPTETTVWSTTAEITAAAEVISIGRPIANTQTYILDEQRLPVPIGAVGDLYIGGEGLSRGYLHRPELTADRFVPNPFAEDKNDQALIYKTGDRARYLADGRILYLGRDDFQVKIRGYRIELGEIETAVSKHPAVAQNVTVAREDKPGERRLVTYIIPQAGAKNLLAKDLREFLRTTLPEYMLPAGLVTLAKFPLTPNGKIDRRALPLPEETAGAIETRYEPPRNELEAQVAALCAGILNLERVSIYDSFFDLGGNSLLGTRLIYQAREQFEVNIPLRQLFMQPTVAGLSAAIEAARHNGHSPSGNGHVDLEDPLFPTISPAELQAEAGLDPSITAGKLPSARLIDPRHVLLTGATGFVGAFLIRDLLSQTEATITCLVRAEDQASGYARLKKNLSAYNLWDESFIDRLIVLPGDLGRPFLGLSPSQFADLARRIDVIYHNGALVNFVYSYQQHKGPNVSGTQEILRLASQERLKAVHFVSTLSIFHSGHHDDGTIYHEDANLDDIGVPFGGYAQSKWVGEKLIMTAQERGIPAAIYRPGLVSGDSHSGTWNTADMMSTMTQACLALGAVPDLNLQVDLVPVDYVSQAIVALSLRPDSFGQSFNLPNPKPYPYADLLAWIKGQKLALQVLPFEEWRQLLINMTMQFGGESWNPFLPLVEEVTADQIFMPAFDCRNTLTGLEDTGITCPPVGPDLLETYFSFFRSRSLVAL